MFQHVAICKLLTETKRGTDYTDPVMPIGKLHAVKTLFSCGQALSRSHPPKPSHDLADKRGVRDLGSLGSQILEESSHPRICSARNAADITLPPHERPCAAPAHTRGDKQTAFDHTTTISPRLTVRAIRPMRSAFITCSASRTVGICTHASPCELYPATVFLHGAGMPGESKSLSRTLCVCHRTHRQKVRPRLPPTFGARPHASHADAHRRGS